MTDRGSTTIPPSSPRRIAPRLGPLAWTGEALSGSDYMLPLGAEHAAELRGASEAPAPRLDALAAALRERLDHGLGFVLLRGLPRDIDDAALRRLGGGAASASAAEASDADRDAQGAGGKDDTMLLLRAAAAATVALCSAAELHNRLLVSDRAALARLYAPGVEEGVEPVFALRDNVFAARQRHDHPAMPVLLRDQAAVALRLPLRAGDVLVLNPLLVWHEPLPTGTTLRLPGLSGRAGVFARGGDGSEVTLSEPPANPQVGG